MADGRMCAWMVATVAFVGIAGVTSAQAPRTGPAPADDPLLREVRALRSDLNTAMSANIRAQFLVGRLQLQEQRMNTLAAQLAEVRRSLATEDAERGELADRLTHGQEMLDAGQLPPDQQRDFEGQIRALTHELSRANPRRDELQAQETEISGQLVSEQGRWIDFNNRLDAIERSLPEQPAPPAR
jgi:hypothetical protein